MAFAILIFNETFYPTEITVCTFYELTGSLGQAKGQACRQSGRYYRTQPPKEINVMCFCGKIMYLISFGDTTNGNGKN